jgi:hypothetical protein
VLGKGAHGPSCRYELQHFHQDTGQQRHDGESDLCGPIDKRAPCRILAVLGG